MDLILNTVPIYVLVPAAAIVLGVVIYIVLKSLQEGREISFWPPKIGPRQTPPAGPKGKPKLTPAEVDEGKPSVDEDSPASERERVAIGEEEPGNRSIRLPANAIALLYLESGPEPGATFPITAGDRILTVGRVSADIVIDDIAISRSHFRIHIRPKSSPHTARRRYEFVVQDLGSANGTMVNGKLVTRKILDSSAVIQAGGVTLHFVSLLQD